MEEGEHRIGGWTVFSPEEANTKFTRKLEEKVLILVSVGNVKTHIGDS